ncbi:hypothetical protein MMC16_007674 [Acarospora aff. strigata]|nr:hypothetical protein [Acarospora aff. strigata]
MNTPSRRLPMETALTRAGLSASQGPNAREPDLNPVTPHKALTESQCWGTVHQDLEELLKSESTVTNEATHMANVMVLVCCQIFSHHSVNKFFKILVVWRNDAAHDVQETVVGVEMGKYKLQMAVQLYCEADCLDQQHNMTPFLLRRKRAEFAAMLERCNQLPVEVLETYRYGPRVSWSRADVVRATVIKQIWPAEQPGLALEKFQFVRKQGKKFNFLIEAFGVGTTIKIKNRT